MKTVYVDEMFVLNLVINYFILIATAKICALPFKRLRFGAAAALGGAYSVMVLLSELSFLASPLMKLCLGAAMTLVAFGYTRRIFRVFAAFLAVSATFGGAVFAAEMLAGMNVDEGLYIEISMKVLVLSFALSYFVLTVVFRRLGKRRKRQTAEVKLALGDKSVVFTALYDSGNELFDPISGQAIMVADISVVEPLLPPGSAEALKQGVLDFVMLFSGAGVKFRLVPFATVGSDSSLMPVFKPDSVIIDDQPKKDLLIGLTTKNLSRDGEYSAVI